MYEPGDILEFRGTDWISRCIQWGTFGPSHVGMIFQSEREPLLVESTTLCPTPCVLTGETLNGVQAQRPADRVTNYAGTVQRYRLSPECSLSADETALLTRLVMHWIGKPYDLDGALLSGTRLLKFSRFVPYRDSGSIFCSALVARFLMRLNRMNWDDAFRFNPANLIRTLRRSGVYQKPEVIHA